MAVDIASLSSVMSPDRFAVGLFLASLCPIPGFAQAATEKVWAVFAYTLKGDSSPAILPASETLTPYGARQLLSSGSAFRERYVALQGDENNHYIQYISPDELDSDEIGILSTEGQSAIASAQAFMQGLYPPLDTSDDDDLYDQSSLNASAYQYPRVITLGRADLGFERIAGHDECPMYEAAQGSYKASSEFQRVAEQSTSFYERVYANALSDVLHQSEANYANAPSISEYLEYEFVHNSSLLDYLDGKDVFQARSLANQYVYATNSNSSSWENATANDIRTIAGQTLASFVLQFFDESNKYAGSGTKLALLFGHYEPVIALASLMRLTGFGSIPRHGASIAFELCSLESQMLPNYPDVSNLYVRFLLHNGTDSATRFIPFPLFGHDPRRTVMSYTDFRNEMETVSLARPEDWCRACNSTAVFCHGVLGSASAMARATHGPMDPTVAGILGAVATTIAFLLMGLVALLILGFRLPCTGRCFLGGFRGGRNATNGHRVTHYSPYDDLGGVEHRSDGASIRPGSWEMDQRAKNSVTTNTASVPSSAWESGMAFNGDTEEWRLHSMLEPVKIRESV